jgi:hypothetical protein
MRDGFWEGPTGRQILWRRRWLRVRRLSLEGEPEQKARRGSGYRSARAQQDLIGQLTAVGQHPLTGPVALDVCFHASRPNPPGPHKLAKHLLDVLGGVRGAADVAGHHHVLYRDDRQVKLLHVTLWAPGQRGGTSGTPRTTITARPLRDVVADLNLVRTVEEEAHDHRGHSGDSPLAMPPIPDIDPEPTSTCTMPNPRSRPRTGAASTPDLPPSTMGCCNRHRCPGPTPCLPACSVAHRPGSAAPVR